MSTLRSMDGPWLFKVWPENLENYMSVDWKYSPAEKDIEDVNSWFSYHSPKDDQGARYEKLREFGKLLAQQILICVPPSADRSTAIRKLRECIMTANAGIACGE